MTKTIIQVNIKSPWWLVTEETHTGLLEHKKGHQSPSEKLRNVSLTQD